MESLCTTDGLTAEVVLMLASHSPCWSASTPFVSSRTGRIRGSSLSDFAPSSYLVCVELVWVPSLQIFCEGSALVFRSLLDCSLQWACRRHIGSDRSGTRRQLAKFTCMGQSRIGCIRAVGCRYRTFDTTFATLVLGSTGKVTLLPCHHEAYWLRHIDFFFQVAA